GAGAYAGYKFSSPPSISPTFAVGIMGSARATADTTAYLGCTLGGTTSGSTANGFCQIADSSGASKVCSFSSASIAQAVGAMPASGVPAIAAPSGGRATPAVSGAEPTAGEATATPPAPTAAMVAAHETARRVVDDAVARGSWRPEDGQALRATLADLDQTEYSDVMGELTRAVNTGRLQIVARDRPMF